VIDESPDTLTKSDRVKDKRGVDLISDALPFGRLWYDGPDAATNAIRYVKSIEEIRTILSSGLRRLQ
jgi:hypothetical protein